MKTGRFSGGCLGLAVLAFAVLFAAAPSEASILVNFTGNTFPQGLGVDGHVNFMVLDKTYGTDDNPWGIDSGLLAPNFVPGSPSGGLALDTAADYLYLYQAVNDGGDTNSIVANSVRTDTMLVSSYGYFSGVGFTQDVAGAPTATAADGPYLGGSSAAAGNPSPAQTGPGGNVALDGSVVDPTGVAINPPGSVYESWTFAPFPLLQGQVSSLWGFTSNEAPVWGSTAIIDGGTSADGTVPTVLIPEPATIIIWSLLSAASWLWMGVWRRGRRVGRQPWSDENRQAIHDIITR